MLIIFDTNVWISDLALASAAGSAVRFYLREQKARICLPEVVRLETEVNLRQSLTEHIGKIRSSHSQLLAVFGQLKEVVLPTQEDVESLISGVFSKVGVEIEEVPFTLDNARASLMRTVHKIVPSDKNQQFKDGVLWENCVKSLEKDSVSLVTNDTAFYQERKYDLGLAKQLRNEIHDTVHQFHIFPSLAQLLSQIKTEFQINSTAFFDAFMSQRGTELAALATERSFALEGQHNVNIDAFVTENPAVLFFNFKIEIPCSDASNEGRTDTRIIINGHGTYHTDARNFSDLAVREEKLVYRSKEGDEKKIRSVYAAIGGVVLGHRMVEYSVRYPLS